MANKKEDSYNILMPPRIIGGQAYDKLADDLEHGAKPKTKTQVQVESGTQRCIGCGRTHNRINENYCSPHCQYN